MDYLIVGIGIAMVFEGVLYALAPNGMKRLMAFGLQQPAGVLRVGGLVLAALGVGLVALIRG